MARFSTLFSALLVLVASCIELRGRDAIAEVPFDFIRDSILVQAVVNGHAPVWMLLDTGADPSVVDLETAKNVGLKLAAKGEKGTGGGTDRNLAYETVLPIVRIGELRARNVQAVGMDLAKVSSALGRPIGGVLGHSLLKDRIVQIDYPKHKVRFYTSAPACLNHANSDLPSCTTLRFRYQDDILATGVRVNGKEAITNVDTGSNSYFQLSPAAVDRLGLREDLARAHASRSTGFNGELKNREGTVRNITLGTISRNEPDVVFFGKGMGVDNEPWDLRIGNKFLKDFVVTFDFQHGQIALATP